MKIVGKWNRSVVLTYAGVAASILGMGFAAGGLPGAELPAFRLRAAMSCLAFAGVFDLADGPVARRCRRSEEEKHFGTELDSLADAVSFVAFPAVIALSLGAMTWYRLLLLIFFAVCGIARLAYFHILVGEMDGEPLRFYRGLPVTYTALLLPLLYALLWRLTAAQFAVFYGWALPAIGVLEILDIPVRKPSGAAYLLFGLLFVGLLLFYWIGIPALCG
ncbi:MAG: CDP-alcohol phosphatidyltransferase family protein [Stomatobaculum sp.]